MIDKELLLKRLSTIKLLYKIGLEQSRQSEAISFASILSFHDSIEMFLKLATEHKDVKADKLNFIDYWEKIPELTLKESMRTFNSRRVNLKHKGFMPAKIEIEASRVNATEFFEQNTPKVFELNFSEISLFDLVKFEQVKFYLKDAQIKLDSKRIEECVDEATKAFHELLYQYKETKRGFGTEYKTHFNFIDKIRYSDSHYNSSNDRKANEVEAKVKGAIKDINKNFESIDKSLEVISLGLDYRKYAKFMILTPIAHRRGDGNYHLEVYGERNWSIENCQFLIDFVLESALKLQEFDFDYESLDLTRTTITFEE